MTYKRKSFSKKATRKLKALSGKATKQAPVELVLGETDVICGRGAGVTGWWGNLTFRYLCFKMKPLYERADRSIKAALSLELINAMATLDPPGRFVELIEGTIVEDRRVVLVPPSQAIEKTCQALREKKNGCPRPFRPYESSKGKKPLATNGPMFSDSQIEALRKELELKFTDDLKPKSKKASTGTTDDDDSVEHGLKIKSKQITTELPNRPKRLTARQAIIESMKESQEPTLKRKELKPEASSPLPTQKKPKVCCQSVSSKRPTIIEPLGPTSSNAPKDYAKMRPLERTIMSSTECNKKAPTSRGMTAPKGLSALRMDDKTPKVPLVTALGEASTMATPMLSSASSCVAKGPPQFLQKDFSYIPERMPAGHIKSERKSTSTKALVSGALDFQSRSCSAAYLDQEMALLPPTMTAFCSGIFSHMMSPAAVLDIPPPPRRYPNKTPRRSHNMLPLEFPSIQPINFDDDELQPLPVDLTTLKPFITQGSQDSGSARSEDVVPMTHLASYLSDFFDKQYFPISSTSQYFSGTACKVAPLGQSNPSGQSPTTVYENFFFDNEQAIASYNQALFEDDLDEKLQPMEAFPDI